MLYVAWKSVIVSTVYFKISQSSLTLEDLRVDHANEKGPSSGRYPTDVQMYLQVQIHLHGFESCQSLSLIEYIQPAFTELQVHRRACSHNVGPIKSLAAILQAEAPVVVLQVVVV
jgi:hypothetical protein